MDQSEQIIVDLIIPAHNEQENIPALCEALPWGLFRHVIVVNNASTDQTAPLAKQGGAVVVDEPGRGYGQACLAGLAWIADQAEAEADVEASKRLPDMVAFFDADLADDPNKLAELCQPIAEGQMDMVIGSRRKLAQRGSLTSTQRFGNWLACFLIRLCTGRDYHDLGPMRVIRWTALEQLKMQDRTWGWTVEMQFKAAVLGMRTLDVHVPYRPRHAGQSKISGTMMGSVKAGYKILSTIGILWWDQVIRKKR